MLQIKEIAAIQEINTLFQNSWTTPENFSQNLGSFNFKAHTAEITSVLSGTITPV